MSEVITYRAEDIITTVGSHLVTGYADDSFLAIDAMEDAVTHKVGCQGEVVRSIIPNKAVTVKLVLLYNSRSQKYLSEMLKRDKKDGTGIFPMEVKDLSGGIILSASQCWVTKAPSKSYGKEAQNGEYTIVCADPEEI